MNQNAVLYEPSDTCTASNCEKCVAKDPSVCIKCADTHFFYKGACHASCPDYSSAAYIGLTQTKRCEPCHYSCKTCHGPSEYQCSTCCDNGSCGEAINDREPLFGKCVCPDDKVESNGICLDKCRQGLYGKYHSFCSVNCPSDSYSWINWGDDEAQESSHYDASSNTDCQDYKNHLKFTKDKKGLVVPGPPGST